MLMRDLQKLIIHFIITFISQKNENKFGVNDNYIFVVSC